MGILEQIEQSAFPLWVREGGSLLGFPTFLFVHTLGLAIVSGLAGGMSLRLLGLAPGIPLRAFRPLFQVIWLAFAATAISGVTLLSTEAVAKLSSPVFYVKMALITVALLLLQRTRAIVEASRDTADAPPPGARLLAGASLTLWIATTIAGRLMAYF